MVFRENRRCVLSPVCVEKKETTQQQQQQQQLLEVLSSVSVSGGKDLPVLVLSGNNQDKVSHQKVSSAASTQRTITISITIHGLF